VGRSENNTIKFCDVPEIGVTVQRGPTLDGLGKYYRMTIEESDDEPVDVVQALRRVRGRRARLPTCRSAPRRPDKFYAQCALDAGVGFVNALPVFIASDPEWAQKFTDAGVPIIGDDIKSQVGATITHRVLARCSRTAAWWSTAPTSSTSAATWTSRTCSSASAWSRRRSPRRRP
jgi:myo-inositol-1-phosphate synthase